MRRLPTSVALIAVLALAIPLAALTVVAFSYEIQVVVSSWLEGRPRMLVKLEIRLPQVDADSCAVMVRRFPTMYNPTKDGYTELIYRGLHPPGAIVKVKNILFAYVAKYRLDPRTNEYVIGYYEPQEYAIFVNCAMGDVEVFKWARIVEVFSRSIIHTERVEVGGSRYELGPSSSSTTPLPSEGDRDGGGGDGGSNPFSCSIVILEESPDYSYKRGECYTWVRGPVIYSIDGLTTSFVLYTYPQSAVYLEAFADSEFCTVYCRTEDQVQWGSIGKKLTPSVVSGGTSGLAGYYKDAIYFYVRYKYEYSVWCDSFAGACYVYWALYPSSIRDFARSAERPYLPYSLYPYTPPTPPYYGIEEGPGEVLIGFVPEGASETDIPLYRVTVSFTYAGVWTASLTVGYYKAVRNDSQYVAPCVRIYSTRYYWWWYKDNDPRNYEVLVAPR